MPQRSNESKLRIEAIKSQCRTWILRDPPTRDRPLKPRIKIYVNGMHRRLGGSKKQIRSVVSYLCQTWGKSKAPRSSPVTEGANLELAAQIMVESAVSSTQLFWELVKRNPKIKCSERSAVTLYHKARAQLKAKRRQLKSKWFKFARLKCNSNLVARIREFRYQRSVATNLCENLIYEMTWTLPSFDLEAQRRQQALELARKTQFVDPSLPPLHLQQSSICLFEAEPAGCQLYFNDLREEVERTAAKFAKEAAQRALKAARRRARKLSKSRLKRNGLIIDEMLSDTIHLTRPGYNVDEWRNSKKHDSDDLLVAARKYEKPFVVSKPAVIDPKSKLPPPVCCEMNLDGIPASDSEPAEASAVADPKNINVVKAVVTPRRRRRRIRRQARPPPGTFKGQ